MTEAFNPEEGHRLGLNPRSCAASSMTRGRCIWCNQPKLSQSAFVRGFIDDPVYRSRHAAEAASLNPRSCAASSMTLQLNNLQTPLRLSQSAFVRGFIDDVNGLSSQKLESWSQSAFVRGFIDDWRTKRGRTGRAGRLNPRSCAASSMTRRDRRGHCAMAFVSIRVRARLHR